MVLVHLERVQVCPPSHEFRKDSHERQYKGREPMRNSVIILAAGKGTRMHSEGAKALHAAAGRSLLDWSLHIARAVDPAEISVVVGHKGDQVSASCPDAVSVVTQEPQLGTGDAVKVGLTGLSADDSTVVVLPADMPLISHQSIQALVAIHAAENAAATIMTVELADPSGYGRIIRTAGRVTGIVEERDATEEQRKITEVNTSVYVFDGSLLGDALGRVDNDNVQSEYYLTDVISILVGDGHAIASVIVPAHEGIGVNTYAQLAEVSAILRGRINSDLLESGVAMLDPARVYVDADVTVEPGATLLPDTYLRGTTSVAGGATVGPDVEATDSVIGSGASVKYSVLNRATGRASGQRWALRIPPTRC